MVGSPDTQLAAALDEAQVPDTTAQGVLDINSGARLEALQVAYAVTALLATTALFFTARIPRTPSVRPNERLRPPPRVAAVRRTFPRRCPVAAFSP
ncbi:putative membrane protein [Rhodococcus opacus]|uniref:Putative membrane protein n=1 Tax=Rhodococcus opacus TaxID=37919 RepID=A0A1B1JY74_RHOOP|nr:putative membrane protein [Rhodococcus opacus]